MCGIVGFYGDFKGDKTHALRCMLTRIRHRGPDESGVFLSRKCSLGSVRLSIIDLESGTMPISNQNESLWIVFNGEIYNHNELREELVHIGYQFSTNSDTEVIVNLYQEYGPSFLNKLNGQFAIAIYDKVKKQLFLGRDRVGIRPLYYTRFKDSFIFASEIKAFLDIPDFNLSISPEAIKQYFTFWTALSPSTLFKEVSEVPPGCFMLISEDGNQIERYWKLTIPRQGEHTFKDLDEATSEFEKLFTSAVELRLRADVPVGAYLSGGIDSSITTSFIKKINPSNLNTFSIGFDEKEFDESSYQKIASDYFGTKHSSVICSSKEITDEFKEVVWHCESPILRTAPTPMKLLAKNVREHNMKVVITGEGADELLGGYNIFKETKIRRFWAKDPTSRIRPTLLSKLYPYLPQIKNSNSNVLKLFFGYKLNETESPIYSHLLRWNNTKRINNYLSEELKELLDGYDPIVDLMNQLAEDFEDFDYLSRAQWLEINLFMSGYLLSSQGDRMAMANSVEGRYPFLDHRIIEFCMQLSPDLKLNGLNEKFLLKKMMKGRIPNVILERSKQAYRAPIRSVFQFDNLSEYLKRMLSEEEIIKSKIFSIGHVTKLLDRMTNYQRISEIDNMALTGILSIQILNDLFINKSIPKLNEDDLLNLDKLIIES
ncbi:asparagine synthase (glutamine-hydrolyzing) [Lutimonas zeaxanthinifaciens]|uniref:asparagine synthase (glutamine-hydrolyzing) n=1 Tax=Lutimonas zeaxanthinifaciens TaxID=3060215 RepID=UPI00265D0A77|nr:asparagine synthase (glutamine-hydrolyzing) [Lutimonas sp. YSD2104]WKK66826.1 asparagine synthase (glutamine-hydrolyzing) [Lutimonas sp. YSD2104]